MEKKMEMPITGACVIRADEWVIPVAPINGTHFTLDEIKNIVGERVEILNMGDMSMAYNPENNYQSEADYNVGATYIAHGRAALEQGEFITGTVLMCQSHLLQ